MKLATCSLLVVLSAVAGAAEPATGWKLDHDLKVDKNVVVGTLTAPSTKCYFIRMVRPLPAVGADPNTPRFIPMQPRASDIVSGSVCSAGGQMLRAVR